MNPEINLNPVFGISRKAIFEILVYNTREAKVSTVWKVIPVDSEGNELQNPILRPYVKELIADRTTFVDPATGEQVPEGTEGSIPEYDFFVHIASNVPVKVHDLIIQTAMTANQNGRFDS
jgi:hypothetical protein